MDLKFYFYYSEIVEAWPGLLFLTISLIIVQSLGVICDVWELLIKGRLV
jgi:hypothetical protein